MEQHAKQRIRSVRVGRLGSREPAIAPSRMHRAGVAAAPALAIATITWARSAAEERVLRRALTSLVRLGYSVAVADTGRRRSFSRFLAAHPELTVVHEAGGLVPQVEASLRLAATFGTPSILYTEPDKEHFFAALPAFLRTALSRKARGLVLAARSTRSAATYPATQRYTEGVINRLCGHAVGRAGDYSYGPFVFPRELLDALLPLPREIGWGWRHVAFLRASRLGMPIRHLAGNYPCPPEQRHDDDDERAHRLRQLSQNLSGLLA